MSAKKKNKTELLLPGESQWELWSMTELGGCVKVRSFPDVPGSFNKDATRHVLALPAAALWVLPAWLIANNLDYWIQERALLPVWVGTFCWVMLVLLLDRL